MNPSHKNAMKYLQLKKQMFIKNRELLKEKINKTSIAIFNSNDVMPTNSDGTLPFIQNSDLFWLSGIDQEESVLLLFFDSEKNKTKEMLFLKETNERIAIWEGAKLTKEEAYAVSGIEEVYWLSDFENILSSIVQKVDCVYLNQNIHSRSSNKVQTRDDRFRLFFKKYYPTKKIKEIAPIMHDLRVIKSKPEVELIQKACDITEQGFKRILSFIKPGVMEYEIEAELIHEFISSRSSRFAYQNC